MYVYWVMCVSVMKICYNIKIMIKFIIFCMGLFYNVFWKFDVEIFVIIKI